MNSVMFMFLLLVFWSCCSCFFWFSLNNCLDLVNVILSHFRNICFNDAYDLLKVLYYRFIFYNTFYIFQQQSQNKKRESLLSQLP